MSTVFLIYPKTKKMPTFQELLDLSTKRLHERFSELNIKARPVINVYIHFKDPQKIIDRDLKTLSFGENIMSAYFYVDDIPHGTDAHFVTVSQYDWNDWMEEDETDHTLEKERTPLILSCLEIGHYWYFRRSINQPPIINLTYGLMSVSLAELTNAYIYSGDGAWDTERFPATVEEFDSWYFRPEMALELEFKEWATQCLKALTTDIAYSDIIRPQEENNIVTELLQKLKENGIT